MGIDIEQTRRFYESIKTEDLCNCAYCKNYYLQIKDAYPFVADCLNAWGIDIEKPIETSPMESEEDGMIEYCACQYIALGNEPNGLVRKIGNVELRVAASHPSTGIQGEHFVIDIYPIKLKWIMQQNADL